MGGFAHYGVVREDYLMIKGGIPGGSRSVVVIVFQSLLSCLCFIVWKLVWQLLTLGNESDSWMSNNACVVVCALCVLGLGAGAVPRVPSTSAFLCSIHVHWQQNWAVLTHVCSCRLVPSPPRPCVMCRHQEAPHHSAPQPAAPDQPLCPGGDQAQGRQQRCKVQDGMHVHSHVVHCSIGREDGRILLHGGLCSGGIQSSMQWGAMGQGRMCIKHRWPWAHPVRHLLLQMRVNGQYGQLPPLAHC
jgi:hypothetical protein